MESQFVKGYELGKYIGRGTYGMVSKCTRKSDGKQLAVKVINFTDD